MILTLVLTVGEGVPRTWKYFEALEELFMPPAVGVAHNTSQWGDLSYGDFCLKIKIKIF